eukprot:scaffold89732_cov59-Phaeocystis_antarctica.AAC.1
MVGAGCERPARATRGRGRATAAMGGGAGEVVEVRAVRAARARREGVVIVEVQAWCAASVV